MKSQATNFLKGDDDTDTNTLGQFPTFWQLGQCQYHADKELVLGQAYTAEVPEEENLPGLHLFTSTRRDKSLLYRLRERGKWR